MSDTGAVAIGLDMGTGGARSVAVDFDGAIIAQGTARLPPGATTVDGPLVEQDPAAWSTAARESLRQLTAQLRGRCHVIGIAVDATSGTFLLADQDHQPLTAGVMYSDQRAADVAPEVAAVLEDVLGRYGIRIASSFALPKIVAIVRQRTSVASRCRHVLHQTDWITGMLTGRYDVTDVSTALKTGADPGRLAWPAEIESLGVRREWLPRVVLPGTVIGKVSRQASEMTGLAPGTSVVAGCTDGTAGCLASGAGRTGDLNVTLGTTLVFKAISDQPLIDPEGMIYNHRHPSGGYLPGAASSTGGDWIEQCLADHDLEALEQASDRYVPGNHVVYPLTKVGERFPFACPTATGFGLDALREDAERFAAGMEAVALLERLGIERFERLGLPINPVVFATGGGVSNKLWLRIRSAANRRIYAVPRNAGCALGAAVLAATSFLGSFEEASRRIVVTDHEIEPNEEWAPAYDERYERFCNALAERGFLGVGP